MTHVAKMTCPECGEAFARTHHRQQFCTPAHSRTFNNRQISRGQGLVSLAQAWRSSRNVKDLEGKDAGRAAFTQLCRMLDEFNAEDREAGRAHPVKLYRQRMAAGLVD